LVGSVGIVGLATLVALIDDASVKAAPTCPPSRWRSERTLVIAHASGDHFGPPNTVEMLRAARTAGADYVDADVRVTRDGVLVAAHDDVISDGKVKLSISTTSFRDLRKIDLRTTWKRPRNVAGFSQPVRIPSIAELLAAFPSVPVSLEFKVTGGEQSLCDLLRRTQRTTTAYVGSAGDAAVDTFKVLCPEVTTTVTDAMVPIMQRVRESGEAWCAPVPIGQPPLRIGLTREYVRWNHDHGLAVFTWTADDQATLREVAGLGVDAVYTERPDLAKTIFSAAQRRQAE
jgi:glycerophosphoryl diester phosphodiesterase